MTNKIVLILLMCIGMALPSQCQQYFNVRDALHSNISLLTSVVQKNNKYYCTGFCVDSINYVAANQNFTNISGVKFAVYDSAGHKLLDTVYQKVFMRSVQPWNTSSLYAMPDNSFLLAAQYQDTAKWYALILKFDSLGHLLSERQYAQPYCNDNDWYKVIDFKPTGTGEWLLLADVSCIDQPQLRNTMALTKLDNNFNAIWTKQYGHPTLNTVPGKVLVESDGYLITGVRDNTNIVAINFQSQAELLKTDTAGAEQWTYLSNIGRLNHIPNDVIKTQDGGYIYCGSGDGEEIPDASNTHGTLYFKGWVEKINASHNPVWGRGFNDYYNSDFKFIKQTALGNINVFGDKYCPFIIDSNNNGNAHTRGWLLTLSPTGDSIAEHTFYHLRTCSDVHHIYDVKKTSDGGYIMAGESTDMCGSAMQPLQRGWLVKIDSNGCIDPITCDQQDTSTFVHQIRIDNGVYLFPNPVKDILQISYGNMKGGKIMIMDLTGKELINTELMHSLDISNLSPGIYLYKVNEQGTIKSQGKIIKL